jgi:hypothetical protein
MARGSSFRPTPSWLARRARAHLDRVRREGLTRVAAADARRGRLALARLRWGLANNCAPNAVPVFVVGIQRSGTDMLIDAFKASPEAEVHNESESSRAFVRFGLREDEVVRGLILASRNRVIVFKALLDADRIVHLMTGLGTPSAGRAIWIYRSMEGRVRSTLARWPENNRRVLAEIAAGSAERWESRGLGAERLELLRSFDYDEITQESASALLWYLRNGLFFDLGLAARDDVLLLSYERFVAEPERFTRIMCDFTGIAYSPRLHAEIAPRPPATAASLELDPGIRELCDDLHRQLESELERRLAERARLAAPA